MAPPEDADQSQRPTEPAPNPSPAAPPDQAGSDPSSSAPATEPPSSAEASSSISEAQSAYNDLRRLIPSLASELDHLRASLREHNVWLQRYGHDGGRSAPTAEDPIYTPPQQPAEPSQAPPAAEPPVSSSSPSNANNHNNNSSDATTAQTQSGSTAEPSSSSSSEPDLPPAYSASDVPPYTGGPRPLGGTHASGTASGSSSYSTIEDVRVRRDQLTAWLAEGEDVLREYSARLAQLREDLSLPPEDVLGTWSEASPDNALPDYRVVEDREDRMVGGVGEVPPPYIGGGIAGKGWRG